MGVVAWECMNQIPDDDATVVGGVAAVPASRNSNSGMFTSSGPVFESGEVLPIAWMGLFRTVRGVAFLFAVLRVLFQE